MSGTIMKINDLDVSLVSFSDPIVNSYGGHTLSVRYGGQPLLIQTPKMRLPFGLGKYAPDAGKGNEQIKYSLDLSFAGYEMGADGKPLVPAIRGFFEKLAELDSVLLDAALKKRVEWFPEMKIKAGTKDDVIRTMLEVSLRPSIRESKQPERYPPTIKTSLKEYVDKKTNEKYFGARFFDDTKSQIGNILEYNIPKQSEAILILRPKITFAKGKYGFSWDVNQARLFPAKTLPTYGFLEDEGDDKPIVTHFKDVHPEDTHSSEQTIQRNYMADAVDELDHGSEDTSSNTVDADEEEVEDEEEEEVPPPRVPTPPPVAPKKGGRATTGKK